MNCSVGYWLCLGFLYFATTERSELILIRDWILERPSDTFIDNMNMQNRLRTVLMKDIEMQGNIICLFEEQTMVGDPGCYNKAMLPTLEMDRRRVESNFPC